MNNKEVIVACEKLANDQNLVFRRSKTINLINSSPCYEIESGKQYKVLHQGNLMTIWETLLSGVLANK